MLRFVFWCLLAHVLLNLFLPALFAVPLTFAFAYYLPSLLARVRSLA